MPTYVEGGVDPVSRLREAIGDPTGRFSDQRLQRWLADSLSDERFLLYLPTGTDGATGATVKVSMETAKLTLTLARTIVGEAATPLELAPSTRRPYLHQVLDWIGKLGKGWQAGLSIGEDLEWFTPSSSTALSLVTVGSFAEHAPSINLALTDDALPAYGSQDDAVELRFYRLFSAAKAALGISGVTDVTRRSEGNVSRSYGGVAALLQVANTKAAHGLYAV